MTRELWLGCLQFVALVVGFGLLVLSMSTPYCPPTVVDKAVAAQQGCVIQ